MRALRPLWTPRTAGAGASRSARARPTRAERTPRGAATMRRVLMVAALRTRDLGHLHAADGDAQGLGGGASGGAVRAGGSRARGTRDWEIEPGAGAGARPGRDGRGTVAFGVGWAPALRRARASVPLAAHLAENARARPRDVGVGRAGAGAGAGGGGGEGRREGRGGRRTEPSPGPRERRE